MNKIIFNPKFSFFLPLIIHIRVSLPRHFFPCADFFSCVFNILFLYVHTIS